MCDLSIKLKGKKYHSIEIITSEGVIKEALIGNYLFKVCKYLTGCFTWAK